VEGHVSEGAFFLELHLQRKREIAIERLGAGHLVQV